MTEATEPAASDPISDLTREELQDLVDDLGTDLYRAQDLIAFVREMCDAADADGSEVTTGRVRGWLGYTGCGGVIVLPEEALPTPATQAGAVAGPATRSEEQVCLCCTFGNHNERCTCDGKECCHPEKHKEP